MSQSRQFAYGKDTIGECECPAVAAGFEPRTGDDSTMPAEMYDEQVRELGFTSARSTIDESDAKKAWLKMIQKMERFPYANDVNLETAKNVAEELGWM